MYHFHTFTFLKISISFFFFFTFHMFTFQTGMEPARMQLCADLVPLSYFHFSHMLTSLSLFSCVNFRPGWNRHTCDCALTSYHGPACARDAPTLILPDITSLPVFLAFVQRFFLYLATFCITFPSQWGKVRTTQSLFDSGWVKKIKK